MEHVWPPLEPDEVDDQPKRHHMAAGVGWLGAAIVSAAIWVALILLAGRGVWRGGYIRGADHLGSRPMSAAVGVCAVLSITFLVLLLSLMAEAVYAW